MPSTNVTASVTVPPQFADEIREELDCTIDRLAARGLPIQECAVEEDCVDTPEDEE